MKKSQFFLVGGAVAALVLVAAPAAAQPASAGPFTPYDYDVGLVNYTFWDTVFVGDTFRFNSVLVRNYGAVPAVGVPFGLRLFSQDSMAGYEDWKLLDLPALSDTERIYWSSAGGRVFDSPGVYVVCRCTVAWTLDQNPENDGGRKRVVVLPRPGVEDAEPASPRPGPPVATLATSLNSADGSEVTWYTIAGSRVRSTPARPGIYFLRTTAAAAPRKVLLVR